MRRKRISRKKIPKIYPPVDVNDWLAKNPGALIECTNQPGNLKITPESCSKRYSKANEPRWANISAEPFHIFVFKMNLIPCRDCTQGARLAAKYAKHMEKTEKAA